MVTSVTILQVNKVMSVLFYGMLLTYLGGIQATTMDKRGSSEESVSSLIIKILQADILKGRLSKQSEELKGKYQDSKQKGDTRRDTDSMGNTISDFQPIVSVNDELLRQKKRYHSPRVLLSDRPPLQPPPLYLIEDFAESPEVDNRTARRKRYAERRGGHRGEYSVCDSESRWVTDKTAAIDIRGKQVTVLGEIKTGNSAIKQYFYETRCREAKPVKNGCRGIDDKHWNSQCKTSQTYVRALSTENNKYVGWRWIRIDTSCLCALSRKLGKS
ncbi:neurotrophin-3-like [Hemiscyllium ocellatum]|uniref:neurotrophin-3-like n=1 Tax=Hemiscyllium ocellatum TaxID=170820 RepID=UPI002965F78C|nr:neurotrophin-3-like [Hemiscyllium ocellatum]